MSTVLWCLFIAGLLHVVSKAPLAVAQSQSPGGYDNHNPRDQQAALEGWGKRALAASLAARREELGYSDG